MNIQKTYQKTKGFLKRNWIGAFVGIFILYHILIGISTVQDHIFIIIPYFKTISMALMVVSWNYALTISPLFFSGGSTVIFNLMLVLQLFLAALLGAWIQSKLRGKK